MNRFIPLLVLGAALWPAATRAQTPALPPATPAPGPTPELLGASFTPVPPVLYYQVPTLPEGSGLVVQSISKDSVAERIGLRRYDVVLSYGKNSVNDVKQLAGLLWATPPGQDNKFMVLRNGAMVPVQYTLKAADLPALSHIKPSGPPTVNLEVEPLSNDRMKITCTYYAGGSSKLQSFTCQGTVDEVEGKLKQMNRDNQIPQPVRHLMDIAVQRLRALNKRQ